MFSLVDDELLSCQRITCGGASGAGCNANIRAIRGIFHRLFAPTMVKSYAPVQAYEAKQLSYDLLNNPKDFYKHNRRYATSFVLNLTFGQRCPICIITLFLG
jgi:hypothetical protein